MTERTVDIQQRYGASLRKQVKKVRPSAPGYQLQPIPILSCRWRSLSMPVTHAHSAARQVLPRERPVVDLSTLCSRTRLRGRRSGFGTVVLAEKSLPEVHGLYQQPLLQRFAGMRLFVPHLYASTHDIRRFQHYSSTTRDYRSMMCILPS
jgi:hypothetical protein